MLRQKLVVLGCPHVELGKVVAKDVIVDGENLGTIADFKHTYDTTIEKILEA